MGITDYVNSTLTSMLSWAKGDKQPQEVASKYANVSSGAVPVPPVTPDTARRVGGRRRTRHKKHKSCKRKKSYKGGNVAFLDARTSLGSSNIVGGKKSRKKRSKKRSNKSNK